MDLNAEVIFLPSYLVFVRFLTTFEIAKVINLTLAGSQACIHGGISPPGATPESLFIEKTNLDGVVFSAVTFGGLFALAFECMQHIGTKHRRSRLEWILFGYSFLLLALGTIGFAGSMKFNDMTFIDDRNYPGGPNGFAIAYYSHWINLMSFICYILMSWVSDAFVLYRGYIIWTSNLWVMIFPTLVYLGSIGSSIPMMNSVRNGTFWNEDSTTLTTAYWSISTAFNVISSVLIIIRLITGRTPISAIPATPGGRRPPFKPISTINVFIESAALSSAWGISLIVSHALKSPFQTLPQRSLGHVQGVSSLLIIIRIIKGRSWPRMGSAPAKTDTSSVGFRAPGSTIQHTVKLTESFPLNNIERKSDRQTMRPNVSTQDTSDALHYSDSTSSKAEVLDNDIKVGRAM
ncbi:hypothetical protein BDQ17DRAFT_1273497 [Cyathus striatus]|nr:hypothetical protein BDQ17DRAFT_1273497 [Cyathus striatus]